jgi:peptide/nickel transport system permease protein
MTAPPATAAEIHAQLEPIEPLESSPVRPPAILEVEARTRPRRHRAHWVALGWLGFVVLLAIFADLLPIADPSVDVGQGTVGPFTTWPEFLGTDRLARSQLSRVIYGARVSLAVGVASALIGLLVGGAIGVLAGYSRGKFDAVVGIVTDSFLAFPALILLIGLSAVLTPSISTLIIGLSLVSLPSYVRLTRANTMRFVDREFVLAARAIGSQPRKIILREIVPNVVAPVAAYLPLITAVLIIAESSLSFLGIGVRAPTASWGNMIADGQSYLRTEPYLVFVPAAVLFVTVGSINVIGEWLRSGVDVRRSAI